VIDPPHVMVHACEDGEVGEVVTIPPEDVIGIKCVDFKIRES